MKPKRYTDLGCDKVSVLMMSADVRDDSHTVCAAGLWLLFRRRRETENAHEAKQHLANLMWEDGAAWIVIIGNELAELSSLDFVIAHAGWHPDHSEIVIDLTPRQALSGIYDHDSKSGKAYH